MAAAKAKEIPKLFAVTLIRSGIRQPYWEKRTLKALGLTKLHKTVIHKNTPSVNGQLNAIKHLISIKPVEVVSSNVPKDDREHTNQIHNGQPVFLKDNGTFDLNNYLEHCRKQANRKKKSSD